MYDVGCKLLNGIKRMYVDSQACVKGRGSEWFRIDIRSSQGCIMSPWLFNVYIVVVMAEGSEISRGGEREEIFWAFFLWLIGGKPERQWWDVLLVCKRGLKVNVGKSKVMMLNGEEELECEICVDGMQLEHDTGLNT